LPSLGFAPSSRYKTAAGFAMEKLNAAPPIIALGNRVR